MGRLDFESGRFSTDYETNEIQKALRGWQSEFGDTIEYYRFWKEVSERDEIFDEPTGSGRVFHGPLELLCTHVTHAEGVLQDRPQGAYASDDLYAKASYDQLLKAGLTLLDVKHNRYLNDRIVYDGLVFRVTNIQITGQVQRRDIMASIEATQVKADQLVNDAQFAQFFSTEAGY